MTAATLWLRWRRYALTRRICDRLRVWIDRESRALLAVEYDRRNGADQ